MLGWPSRAIAGSSIRKRRTAAGSLARRSMSRTSIGRPDRSARARCTTPSASLATTSSSRYRPTVAPSAGVIGLALCRAEGLLFSPSARQVPPEGRTKPPLPLVKRSQGRRNHGLRPVCELIFPRPQKPAPDAKRCAKGAPNIPEKEGGSGRGDEVPPCMAEGRPSSPGLLARDQVMRQRVDHRLGPGADAQLLEDVAQVVLDRPLADAEVAGDDLVRHAAPEQAHHPL